MFTRARWSRSRDLKRSKVIMIASALLAIYAAQLDVA
jgi:hypothetical protein